MQNSHCYGELSTFFEELLSTAADAGAQKHWRGIRCASAEDARGLIVSMLRRSWGMAALLPAECPPRYPAASARLWRESARTYSSFVACKAPFSVPVRLHTSEHFGRNRNSEGVH